MIEKYLRKEDWRVKENSNMGYSLQGLNQYLIGKEIANYWLDNVYSKEIGEAHSRGFMHIHDLSHLGAYCVGLDLEDLINVGYVSVNGKIGSKPAKHLSALLGQIVNLSYTISGEVAGAIAWNNFDTLLAPFVKEDKLTYKEVKQLMQEFIFNMNIPTRVGHQCVSEDTEIMTVDGWKKYNEINVGDKILTLNIDTKKIEEKEVLKMYVAHHKGIMYHLKDRDTDQLLTNNHRVVRYVHNSNILVLEELSKACKMKHLTIPKQSKGQNGVVNISDDEIKLIAWLLSDGYIGSKKDIRMTIFQNKYKHKKKYLEIKRILDNLGIEYTERESNGWGECSAIRLRNKYSREIREKFFNNEYEKHIPKIIKELPAEKLRLFIDEYLKGDGNEEQKTVEFAFKRLYNDFCEIVIRAGYTYSYKVIDRRNNGLNKKLLYKLSIYKGKKHYFKTKNIKVVDYDGIVWCPTTENGTIIARRNGKVFITGNSPFSNLTFDLEVPHIYRDRAAIVGGKMLDYTYADCQKEMDMINRVFCEVMMEGDGDGKIFSFPIPTYNITKEFDWENPNYKYIWEMTAKYGTPYFANYINSDMSPEDARSMCCRIKLDVRELKKKGGGLFGANSLTGSIGVVTINLPRIGYLAQTEEELFAYIDYYMDLAKQSLIKKREFVEELTEKELYPYMKFYLRNVKKRFGEYWKNHFNTIGYVGLNECVRNFMGVDLTNGNGHQFGIQLLKYMNKNLLKFQEETGQLFNLEATPAEGTSYRLARKDKNEFGDIITAGTISAPYYTNSCHLPVNYSNDIFEVLDLQDPLQVLHTGGSVVHLFLGERVPANMIKVLLRKIFNKYHLPYLSFTPTFSICKQHGYIAGEHWECPYCGEKTLIFSRVVGFFTPVQNWNIGKSQEFKERKTFEVKQ